VRRAVVANPNPLLSPSPFGQSRAVLFSTPRRQDAKAQGTARLFSVFASLRLCVEKEADLNPSGRVHPSSGLFRPVRHAVVANPNPLLSPSPFGQSGAVHFSTPRRQGARTQGTASRSGVSAPLRRCVEIQAFICPARKTEPEPRRARTGRRRSGGCPSATAAAPGPRDPFHRAPGPPRILRSPSDPPIPRPRR